MRDVHPESQLSSPYELEERGGENFHEPPLFWFQLLSHHHQLFLVAAVITVTLTLQQSSLPFSHS
jgi:hypothetical protein